MDPKVQDIVDDVRRFQGTMCGFTSQVFMIQLARLWDISENYDAQFKGTGHSPFVSWARLLNAMSRHRSFHHMIAYQVFAATTSDTNDHVFILLQEGDIITMIDSYIHERLFDIRWTVTYRAFRRWAVAMKRLFETRNLEVHKQLFGIDDPSFGPVTGIHWRYLYKNKS